MRNVEIVRAKQLVRIQAFAFGLSLEKCPVERGVALSGAALHAGCVQCLGNFLKNSVTGGQQFILLRTQYIVQRRPRFLAHPGLSLCRAHAERLRSGELNKVFCQLQGRND